MKEQGIAGPSRETQISIASSSSFPGFKFSPTDEELISYYLKKKMEGCEKSVEIISEVEICQYEPWDLPSKSVIQSQNEWFFFSAHGRKYPSGSQSKRATALGYWKATGKERDVKSGYNAIGTKRTLVFHIGRAPKGERTEWIMHEYCMHRKSQNTPVICRLRRNAVFCLHDASNMAYASQTQVTAVGNSGKAALEGGTGQMGVPEGDTAIIGGQAKSTSGSHDSHSIGLLGSISELNQKLLLEAAQAESSIHQKDSNPEEDFYADILKDDIIKLDESVVSVAPNSLMVQKNRLETELESRQSSRAFMAPAPILGMTNRRVKFNEQNLEERFPGISSIASEMDSPWIENNIEEYDSRKDKDTNWSLWWPPSHLIRMIIAEMTIRQRVVAVVVVLFLVVLSVFVIVSSRKLQ